MTHTITATLWLSCVFVGVETDDRVTLHLWNIPTKNTSGAIGIARRRVFEEFCKRNPDIRVRGLIPLQIQGPAATGRYFLGIAGGVAPDVFYLGNEQIGAYIKQGFLFPLDAFLDDYRKRKGRPFRGINAPDKVWEVCQNGGRILCVPHNFYGRALYCRDSLFARQGLPRRAPKNWEELYEFARRTTLDPEKEPDVEKPYFGFRVITGTGSGWEYVQSVWSGGGDVIRPYLRRGEELIPVPPPQVDFEELNVGISNRDQYEKKRAKLLADLKARGLPTDYSVDDLEWRLVTNTPRSMEAFKWYRRLFHQPWLRNGKHEFDVTREMYLAGKAIDPYSGDEFDLHDDDVVRKIYNGVTYEINFNIPERVQRPLTAMWQGSYQEVDQQAAREGFPAPFPSLAGEEPAAFISAFYLGINAAIEASNEPGRGDVDAIRDAAWRYVEFVTAREAQKLKMEVFLEHGVEERVMPELLVEAGYSDILERIPPERNLMWDHLQNYPRAQPYCDGSADILDRELTIPLEAMATDRPDIMTGRFSRDLQELMDLTCHRANTLILGKIPDQVVRRRAKVGWIIMAVMMTALGLACAGVVKLAMRAQAKARDLEGFGVGGKPARRRVLAWLLLLPAVGTIFIWSYFPLAKGLVMAFQDFKIVGDSTYVGLRNFIEVAAEPNFWRYLVQTFQYMALLVGIGFCVPIALALLLHEIPKGKIVYRVIYYLPAVTTGMVTLFLWKGLLYNPHADGALNRMWLWLNTWEAWAASAAKLAVIAGASLVICGLLAQSFRSTSSTRERIATGVVGSCLLALLVGYFASHYRSGGFEAVSDLIFSKFDMKKQDFLRDPSLAMFWCVVPPIWASAGPACLIYLAALKGIPEEQYEAADIDGAGVWRKLWNVTVPNLKALIIINFVGAVIAGFKESGNIFVMTGGGPEDKTITVGLEIWYNAFLYLNFGRATAMAWIMGALLIGFTLNQLRILNKLQFRSVAVEAEVRGGQTE
jgi:ABC-type sugar transport system permease subunit